MKKSLAIILSALAVIAAFAGGFILLRSHNQKINRKPSQVKINDGQVAVANPNVPASTSSTPPPSEGIPNSKDNGVNQPSSSLSPNVQPKVPVGNFVGDHRPNLNDSNTETSTCTTTPGALCKIIFTSGSTVRSLLPQKTDANGSTSWNDWKLQSISITPGTWTVSAIAINGSKTATAQDATKMTVSQ